jgi:predicted SAM-dependent methyltransferase
MVIPRRLHIGGKCAHPDWEIINAVAGPNVDHLGNAKDLSRFEDETFFELYASHVLEHFDYSNELNVVLREWYRVLKPGGRLYGNTERGGVWNLR